MDGNRARDALRALWLIRNSADRKLRAIARDRIRVGIARLRIIDPQVRV